MTYPRIETDEERRRLWPRRRNFTVFVVVATVLLWLVLAHFAPAAHADPTCQYLGTNYPVKYDCLQNQPWLPYGTYDNPPNTGAYPGTNCSLPMNQHNQGCS